MNGREGTTTFLPLDFRIGGQNKESLTVGQYPTRDQTRYIYKKVETGEMMQYRYNTARNRTGKAAK